MRSSFSIALAVLLFSGCVEPEAPSQLLPRALGYLASVQNDDGGYGPGGNGSSDFSTSAWVALALGSADPQHDSLPALRSYLANQSAAVRDNATGSFSPTNAASLYVMASTAIDVADRDQHLARLRGLAGETSLAANEQIFMLGALGGAGETAAADPVAKHILAKLLDPQDADLSKDAWMRAHAILALLVNGVSADDPDLRAAARSLLPFQKEDSGFRSSTEYEPDASTTAAVVAVLAQIRFVYSHEKETGLDFIVDLQESTGHVRFSEEFDFSPVKTTAEAVLAATGDGPFRR